MNNNNCPLSGASTTTAPFPPNAEEKEPFGFSADARPASPARVDDDHLDYSSSSSSSSSHKHETVSAANSNPSVVPAAAADSSDSSTAAASGTTATTVVTIPADTLAANRAEAQNQDDDDDDDDIKRIMAGLRRCIFFVAIMTFFSVCAACVLFATCISDGSLAVARAGGDSSFAASDKNKKNTNNNNSSNVTTSASDNDGDNFAKAQLVVGVGAHAVTVIYFMLSMCASAFTVVVVGCGFFFWKSALKNLRGVNDYALGAALLIFAHALVTLFDYSLRAPSIIAVWANAAFQRNMAMLIMTALCAAFQAATSVSVRGFDFGKVVE